MSFKLIAIRPLNEKNHKFLKNLKPKQVYKFTSDYNFQTEDDENIKITKNIKQINLYNQDIQHSNGDVNQLSINISAIVGKNGSGKSSLMELLYVSFYKIARLFNIIEESSDEQQNTFNEKEFLNVLKQINELVEIKNDNSQALSENIEEELNAKYSITWNMLNEKYSNKSIKKDYDRNTHDLNIEVYYELEEKLFLIKLINNDFNLYEYEVTRNKFIPIVDGKKVEKEILKNISTKLFYNLVVNYSLYGLNSSESGDWIEKIFHKNDSYQTPIVLNPFRNKGNIDINSENYLVRSRLLALILAKDVNNKIIATGKEIKRVKLGFTEKELIDTPIYWERFITLFFPKLHYYFFTIPVNGEKCDLDKIDYTSFERKEGILYDKTLKYILKKIDNIVNKYPTFKKYQSKDDSHFINHDLENDLIKDLFQDRSHITLKLRQAINFYEFQDYVNNDIIENEKIIEIYSLENSINSYFETKSFVDLIDYIPPSFFKIELYFDKENEENNFSNLSSGEKQKIYSLNSIIYHLRNLLSVNKNIQKEEINLIAYKNFNIILDEIELYYHPELQRTFIYDLIEFIKKIDFKDRYFDCIPSINIIFITHSPFILSDIPKQNILFLEIDENEQSQPQDYKEYNTFAGNIHEMLTNGFF